MDIIKLRAVYDWVDKRMVQAQNTNTVPYETVQNLIQTHRNLTQRMDEEVEKFLKENNLNYVNTEIR